MGVTLAAHHLDPAHAVAVIGFGFDVFFAHRRVETRPAGAGIELSGRAEQLVAAADTPVGAIFVVVPIGAGERALGAFLARDRELLVGQLLFPLVVGFFDLIR
jgi:hypothetical protein